jgi:AraC family transcriptional regulator
VIAAVNQLVAWARERGLADGQWLGYQWEDPELVPLAQCRYDVAVVVPEAADLGDEVNSARFPPMRVAELAVAGGIDLELRALEWLYSSWLPRSGMSPDHQPCFEAWAGAPFAQGDSHFELTIQLAVTS